MGGLNLNLNLSTRPFPAYRAINLGLCILLVVLIALSVWQTYAFLHYSNLSAQIRQEEQNSRVHSEMLGGRMAEMQARLNRPEAAAKRTAIDYLNSLIARKRFSWTRLFAILEEMVPTAVHLTSLRPEVEEGGKITLHIGVRGRTIPDIADFIGLLQNSGYFADVQVSYDEKKDGAAVGEFDAALTMSYMPEKEIQ